jgi:hypothetical protein
MFHICFIEVKLLPEDDQDRPKHVGVLKGTVSKYNFNISVSVGLIIWIIYQSTDTNNINTELKYSVSCD